MDIVPFGLKYLAECEFRKIFEEDKEKKYPICMKISEAYGHTFGANPKLCAECMLTGTQNQSVIDRYIIKAKLDQLHLAHLGFYTNEEDIEQMLVSLWPYVKADAKIRASIATRLEQMVRLKRISLERAEKIVTNHLKELQSDEHIGTAKAGGGSDFKQHVGLGLFTPPTKPAQPTGPDTKPA